MKKKNLPLSDILIDLQRVVKKAEQGTDIEVRQNKVRVNMILFYFFLCLKLTVVSQLGSLDKRLVSEGAD